MLLYRVFPCLASARNGEPGNALHIPPSSGVGRADNPDKYQVLYLSDSPAGAVAEAFGTLKVWTPRMFPRPDLPASQRAIATYEVPPDLAIFDLDDASALNRLGLRPSQVVTRDREVTQRWALAVYEQGRWGGVRWWSYYNPTWYSYAVWEAARLTLQPASVQRLTIDSPVVVEAAEALRRPRMKA